MCCYSDLTWNDRINEDQHKHLFNHKIPKIRNLMDFKYELHDFKCINNLVIGHHISKESCLRLKVFTMLSIPRTHCLPVLPASYVLWNSIIICQCRPRISILTNNPLTTLTIFKLINNQFTNKKGLGIKRKLYAKNILVKYIKCLIKKTDNLITYPNIRNCGQKFSKQLKIYL